MEFLVYIMDADLRDLRLFDGGVTKALDFKTRSSVTHEEGIGDEKEHIVRDGGSRDSEKEEEEASETPEKAEALGRRKLVGEAGDSGIRDRVGRPRMPNDRVR
jgi:hypothetical protein